MKRTKNGGIDKRYGPRHRIKIAAPKYHHRPTRTSSYVGRDLFGEIVVQCLTMKEVAERMGKHPVSLSYWKAGKHEMRILDAEEMARVLGYKLVMVKL